MNKIKKLLISCASALFLVCSAVAFAACDIGKKEYYSVTLTYEAAQGTVTKTDPADAKGYVADEEVTVTVTPAENYETDAVTVNGGAVTLTEGKYTFKVTGNMTVAATFKTKSTPSDPTTPTDPSTPSDPSTPDENATFTIKYTFNEEGGTVRAVQQAPADGYKYNTTVTVTAVANPYYELSEFKVNGAAVTLPLANNRYTFQITQNTEIVATFVSVPAAFASEYVGTWKEIGKEEGHTLAITANTLTFDGTAYNAFGDAQLGYVFNVGDIAYNAFLTDDGYVLFLNDGADSYTYYTKDGATLPDEKIHTPDFLDADFTLDTVTYTVDASGALKHGVAAQRILTVEEGASRYDVSLAGGAVESYGVLSSGTAIVDGAWYKFFFTTYKNNKPAYLILEDVEGEAAFYAQQYKTVTAFGSDYQGEWVQIFSSVPNQQSLQNKITFPASGGQFTRVVSSVSTSFTAQAYGQGGYIFKWGAFNSTVSFLNPDKTFLSLRSGAMSELYIKSDSDFLQSDPSDPSGKKIVGLFPEQFRGMKWDNETFGRFAVDGAGNGSIEGAKNVALYLTYDKNDESKAVVLYNGQCWTIEITEEYISLLNFGMAGATGYVFERVGAAQFDDYQKGTWKIVDGTDMSAAEDAETITVKDKSLIYQGEEVEAEIMSRFEAYIFTVKGTTYTFGVRPDGILWLGTGELSLGSDANGNDTYDNITSVKYFLNTAETYGTVSLVGVVPATYYGKDYKNGSSTFTIAADGANATIDGHTMRFLTAEINNSEDGVQYLVTALANSKFYEIIIEGATVNIGEMSVGLKAYTQDGAVTQDKINDLDWITTWNEIGGSTNLQIAANSIRWGSTEAEIGQVTHVAGSNITISSVEITVSGTKWTLTFYTEAKVIVKAVNEGATETHYFLKAANDDVELPALHGTTWKEEGSEVTLTVGPTGGVTLSDGTAVRVIEITSSTSTLEGQQIVILGTGTDAKLCTLALTADDTLTITEVASGTARQFKKQG